MKCYVILGDEKYMYTSLLKYFDVHVAYLIQHISHYFSSLI